jgi:hypothetical protein
MTKYFLARPNKKTFNAKPPMSFEKNHPPGRGETRRQFIRKTTLAAGVVAGAGLLPNKLFARDGQDVVWLLLDPEDPATRQAPVQWAVGELRDALARRGINAIVFEYSKTTKPSQPCLLIASSASKLAQSVLSQAKKTLPETPEAIAFVRGTIGRKPQKVLLAGGSDARGLVYALLEIADRVNFAANPLAALQSLEPAIEQPANAIRSVARAFVSDVEDKSWFQDRAFWSRYLSMLAAQRFNRFSLMFGIGYDFTSGITDCYFHFAYPFLLSVPGYNVQAVPLPDAERDSNFELLKFISDETARRGMHFQLGLWTHAYKWTNSPKANYVIEGLTPETQAPYCRDALRTVLRECPSISGITFRIHGESGVPEGQYGLWKTIFDGVAQCGRRVEIDMHAKGMDQGMIDVALGTGMPVNISPKFWAEHMGLPYMQGAIRQQEMPRRGASDTGFFSRSSGSRSFLRYGYGDLLSEDRKYGVLHRLWPGTQRLLLWGDPQTAAAYGRVSSFCGNRGLELFEPLFFKGRKGSGLPGGRDAYADASLRPDDGDFEKYLYTYRVWGRSLYNPDSAAEGARRLLQQQFGRAAESVEGAMALAGKILPLVTMAHCPSAANNNYWPEMYFNMPIVDANRKHPYGDTPSPKRLGTVSPLDPEFFLGLDEFADELIKGEASGKYSPVWVAGHLEDAADNAASQLRKSKSRVRDNRSAEFRRLSVDVAIQSGMGPFYANKFRAGVLYALYLRSGHQPALKAALESNRSARAAWAELAQLAKGVYRDDVTFGPEYFQRGHWLDRLPAMDADIADMEKLLKQPPDATAVPSKASLKVIEQAMHTTLSKPKRDNPQLLENFHTPSSSFKPGQAIAIVANLTPTRKLAGVSGLRLRYRRVNQAETWRMIEMEKTGREYRAVIAAEYANSPSPIQYHFQIRTDSGSVRLYPGLQPGWHGQPYFVVRQTA